jgi:hypothetical protein
LIIISYDEARRGACSTHRHGVSGRAVSLNLNREDPHFQVLLDPKC